MYMHVPYCMVGVKGASGNPRGIAIDFSPLICGSRRAWDYSPCYQSPQSHISINLAPLVIRYPLLNDGI